MLPQPNRPKNGGRFTRSGDALTVQFTQWRCCLARGIIHGCSRATAGAMARVVAAYYSTQRSRCRRRRFQLRLVSHGGSSIGGWRIARAAVCRQTDSPHGGRMCRSIQRTTEGFHLSTTKQFSFWVFGSNRKRELTIKKGRYTEEQNPSWKSES